MFTGQPRILRSSAARIAVAASCLSFVGHPLLANDAAKPATPPAVAPPAGPPTAPPTAPPATAPAGTPADAKGAAATAPPRLSQEELQKRREAARDLLKNRAPDAQGAPGVGATGIAPQVTPKAPVEAAVTESKSVRFEPPDLDLGEMTAEIAKTGTVKLVNITDHPVIVTRVVPSCGCTTAPAPKDPIPVGGSVEIPITLKPGAKQGVQLAKKVTFQIEGDPPVIYAIKGQVAEYVRVTPELMTANAEDPESGKVVLTAVDNQPFKILGVNPAIVTDYGTDAKTEHVVHVDWAKWAEAGSGVKVAFAIDHPKLPSASAMIKRPLPPRDPNAAPQTPLAKAADSRAAVDPNTSELVGAARKGDIEAMKMALEKGAKIEDIDRQGGRNALHWAAREGKLEAVAFLLERGAKIETEDRTGKTALTIAAEGGKTDMVLALIKAGANVNHRDKIQGSPVLWAAGLGNPATVRALLDAKADVLVADVNGLTPLLWAAGIGDPESVKALLAANADSAAKDKIDGDDALTRAIRSGKVESVRLLIEKGANVNSRNEKGATPLLVAAGNGSFDKVKTLIEAKANLAAKDNSGRGLIDYANNRIDPDKERVVAYLTELVAKGTK